MHELRRYLAYLLDHQCQSHAGSCRDCRTLQQIYQFMQAELFSTVIYPEAALEGRTQALAGEVSRAAAKMAGMPQNRH